MKGRVALVPVPGATIRNPRTGAIVSGQISVELDTFWLRRLEDGSMQYAPVEVPEKPAKTRTRPLARSEEPSLLPEA